MAPRIPRISVLRNQQDSSGSVELRLSCRLTPLASKSSAAPVATSAISRRARETGLKEPRRAAVPEVGAFYWTVLAPDIVNPGREKQGLVSL